MLARILGLSIRRRFSVVVLAMVVAAFGIAALLRLPIDAVPDITNNQVQIDTPCPALSPVEVEKQVTLPIETALAGIPGLRSTRSLSRNGFSQVTVVFDDAVDVYFARAQVSERLVNAREALPRGLEPRLGPIATGLGEIFMYVVEYEPPPRAGAGTVPGSAGWQADGSFLTPEGEVLRSKLELVCYLRTVQDWLIRPRLRTVPGVAGVDTIGGYVKQYHVEPDPMRLVSYGLTFADVISALERNNAATGAGYVEHNGEALVVRATGRIEALAEIAEIAVAVHEGTPILIRDVANVAIGRELRTGSASEDGQEVVIGTALMLVGSNSRTVATAVEARVREIARNLPPGVRVKPVLDRTKLVTATIGTIEKNLGEGALLVVVLLFLMLGNVRAALICAVAIPLAMLIAAILMVGTRVSGNLMSLGAIDFGLVVDGAIITVENCLRALAARQRELGRMLTLTERLRTVRGAGSEVLGVSAFGQAIIVVVYVPILALTGVEGKLFHPMALTVIFALGGAFLVALTVVPALVALTIRGRVAEHEVLPVRVAKRVYEPLLRFAVRRRHVVVLAALIAFGLGIAGFTRLGQEFVPTLDEKDLAVQALRMPSTSLTQSTEMQLEVERTISRFKEVAFVFSKTGTAEVASDPMPPNVSDTFVILRPRSEWPDPKEDKAGLVARLEAELGKLPGNDYEFTQPIQMRFNELLAGVRGDVAVKVHGEDFVALGRTAERVAAVLSGIRGAADVKVEQTEGLPMLTVAVERRSLARLGLTVEQVQDVVAAAVGGRNVGVVYEGDRRVDLVVRLPEALRTRDRALANLPVPLPELHFGPPDLETEMPGFVQLGTLARIEVGEGTNQVSRENGQRRVVVQCNVRGRDLGSFVAEAQQRVAALAIPPGEWLAWGGQYENLLLARERLAIVVPLCFLGILLLLLGSFRSLRLALLVFTGVPLGLTGGIVALWLRDLPFSISAAVGFIALSGVAVLNGLVMLAFVTDLRRRGVGLEDAIVQGAIARLRPVLTTALVASFGFVPMAFATGTGAEVQKPLATVVIGGIVSSTLLTLLVLPALYRIVARRDPVS